MRLHNFLRKRNGLDKFLEKVMITFGTALEDKNADVLRNVSINQDNKYPQSGAMVSIFSISVSVNPHIHT